MEGGRKLASFIEPMKAQLTDQPAFDANLKKIVRKTSSLDVPIKETSDMNWVEPALVCNIKFTEITADGSVRHPVFQGLRVDKIADKVKLEKPVKKN